jgi:hypothetical protein
VKNVIEPREAKLAKLRQRRNVTVAAARRTKAATRRTYAAAHQPRGAAGLTQNRA